MAAAALLAALVLAAPAATRTDTGRAAALANPTVTNVTPAPGATSVSRDAGIAANVSLPNGVGIDRTTMTTQTVRIVRVSDGDTVASNRNTSAVGDLIVMQPIPCLDAHTTYRFEVTSGVQDEDGASFVPFSSTFTTGSRGCGAPPGVAFRHLLLPTATGYHFTSLAIGPDGKLYAGTLEGDIVRFPLEADGTTGPIEVLGSLRAAAGHRYVLGVAFDPGATARNLVLWVSTTAASMDDAPDWTGTITRLSGADLQTVRDWVVGLPRSVKDHATNSLTFGPDGALYFTQGSNTSTGAPDPIWGDRPEHLLNAAVLRLVPGAVTSPPLNVKTERRHPYDPFAPGAPLTIYASGLRNAFDLLWDSNGHLYAPTNGASAGGATPGTPRTLPAACSQRIDEARRGPYTGPAVPALSGVPDQHDYLFDVRRGAYYGHPDPARCEWVLNGGNPTAGADPAEVAQYPVHTLPDRNWRQGIFDFGLHTSPDGIIEYRGGAFGGKLNHALLVARYSLGDDIVVLMPSTGGRSIASYARGIPGMTGLANPLDLVEDRRTGYIYVSELGAGGIALLRPMS